MECNSEKLGEIPEMEDLWIVQRGGHFLGIFEKKKGVCTSNMGRGNSKSLIHGSFEL